MNNGTIEKRLTYLEELTGLPDQKIDILCRILREEPVNEEERRLAFGGPPKGPFEEWLRALASLQ
jgi:hypothetical protein